MIDKEEAVARMMADVDASDGWREANPDEWKLYINDVDVVIHRLEKSGFAITPIDGESVTVPRELTSDMLGAASIAIQKRFRGDGGWCGAVAAKEMFTEAWRAAIAATEHKEG